MKKNKMIEPAVYKSITDETIRASKKHLTVEDTNISAGSLDEFRLKTTNIAEAVDDMVELFPDIQLAIEIMTSLIISPNDMQSANLTYSMEGIRLPMDTTATIMDVTREYVRKEYELNDKLDTIISETLFTRGSYVELNIPPTNLKDMMTILRKRDAEVGTEDLVRNATGNHTLSSYKDDEGLITVSDNHNFLFMDKLNHAKVSGAVETVIYGLGSDAETSIGLEKLFLVNDEFAIMDDMGVSGDKPIIKKVEAFNVVPVYARNDHKSHYGYFVFLDEKGNTLELPDPINEQEASNLISKVNRNLQGMTAEAPQLENLDDLRNMLLSTKVKKYLEGSVYNGLVEPDLNIDSQLTLAVADMLAQKSKIRLIFVPSELVSFYAINYRDNGTGESLLERITVLASMRGIILYTNMLAFIKSSVTTTNVNVELDPDDPNAKDTMEKIMARIFSNRQLSIPIGMLKAGDFTDWARKLGYNFKFTHPDLPEISIDVEEVANEINPIDTTLKEDIDKQIITSLYLTPEILDNSYSPDFATTIIANNLLLSKRVMKLQTSFNKLFTKDIRKKLRLDGAYKQKIADIVSDKLSAIRRYVAKNNQALPKEYIKSIPDKKLVDWLVDAIISSTVIELPSPEVTADENTTEMFDNYSDLLDNVIDKVASTDLIPTDLIGDLGDNLDTVKEAMKVVLLRKYVDENSILPDLTTMLSLDENGKPNTVLLDEFQTYVGSLGKLIVPFLKDNKKFQEKLNEQLAKLDEETTDTVDDNNADYVDETTVEEPGADETPPADEAPADETPTGDEPPADEPPVEGELPADETPPEDTPPEDTPPAEEDTPPEDTPPEEPTA